MSCSWLSRALRRFLSTCRRIARVDLIRDDDGARRLPELELTEPSLFFVHAPGAAERLAAAVLRRLGAISC
jgi:hypothetical protein